MKQRITITIIGEMSDYDAYQLRTHLAQLCRIPTEQAVNGVWTIAAEHGPDEKPEKVKFGEPFHTTVQDVEGEG